MKICSVENCNKPVRAYGFCGSHYSRWRQHGSPTAGRTMVGAPAAFLKAALQYDDDDCLLWPFGKLPGGYGTIEYEGRTHLVHELVCKTVYGQKPTPKHEVAHSCGIEGCINQKHLRWDTHKGNLDDRIRHGTVPRGDRHGLAKLTAEQVHTIRSQPRRRLADLALEFGVSAGTISQIRGRTTWGWLSEETVFSVVSLRSYSSGVENNIFLGKVADGMPHIHVQVDHRAEFDIKHLAVVNLDADLQVSKGYLDANDLALVRRYIDLNRDAILDHWHGRTDGIELSRALKPLVSQP